MLLAVAILLWLTDFAHRIPSSVVGMGVGLFALLPRVGILDIEDMKRLNYLPVFFVAAAVSMGTVLEATKGLDVLTTHVFAWMQPYMTNILSTTIVMYWTAFIYHFLLASEISMLGTSIPLVMEFAKAQGVNPLQLGMIWTFAAGGKLFAYQSGVLIVGYSYGYFAARDLVRMGAWLTIVEFLVLASAGSVLLAADRTSLRPELPMSSKIELCSTSEVAPGAALKVERGDLVLAVFNVEGEFHATDDACTHGPGSLSEGYIEGDIVECNFHNGQFNIKTGEVVAPPCMIPVKTYRTVVEDGKVFIVT